MNIEVFNGNLCSQACDAIVLGLFKNANILYGNIASIDKATDNIISKYVIEKDKFEANYNETYILQTYDKIPASKIVIVGLGEKDDLTLAKLRELSAKTIKKINKELKAKTVYFDLSTFDSTHIDQKAQMITEGAIIGEYAFDKYISKKKSSKIEKFFIAEKDEDKVETIKQGIEKGKVIANALNFTRDLANEPADLITPEKLAEIAKKAEGVKTKIYEKDDIQDMGMEAFYAVSKGSAKYPKFIHMKYVPQKPKKKIALIGKGITFDAGGMDIKTAANMLTMRDDMSGAACVISIMKALKHFNPNVEVHGIVAACENMVNGNSYKPGDILRAKNGKTIEVYNTDAEGRITLADALCYACELGVDEVIDIATLTGACMVAFGTQCSGILGNNDELVDRLIKTGEEQGEHFWKLPMFEEYFDNIKSDVADMKNTGGRSGGASVAGLFLKEFVTDNVAWAHLDIAGTAFLDKPQHEFIKGATGVGVRTLFNYILEQGK